MAFGSFDSWNLPCLLEEGPASSKSPRSARAYPMFRARPSPFAVSQLSGPNSRTLPHNAWPLEVVPVANKTARAFSARAGLQASSTPAAASFVQGRLRPLVVAPEQGHPSQFAGGSETPFSSPSSLRAPAPLRRTFQPVRSRPAHRQVAPVPERLRPRFGLIPAFPAIASSSHPRPSLQYRAQPKVRERVCASLSPLLLQVFAFERARECRP